jgi:formylglycine-generating enzyme required for sulfatase activity
MNQNSVRALTALAAIAAASAGERATVAKDLVSHLGGDWATDDGAGDGIGLWHLPTDLPFVAVPGGEFQMGITDADLAAVATYDSVEPDDPTLQLLMAYGRPVRTVRVLPFLVSRDLVALDASGTPSIRERFGPGYHRADAQAAAARFGFRLPSEAEFEWIAREGGVEAFVYGALKPLDADQIAALRAERDEDPEYDIFDEHQPPYHPVNRFGVNGLFCRQWMADDWHPTFEGAPDTSEPWLDGDPQGVRRGDSQTVINWEHVAYEVFYYLLAGLREPGDKPLPYSEREERVGLRFAAPLHLG